MNNDLTSEKLKSRFEEINKELDYKLNNGWENWYKGADQIKVYRRDDLWIERIEKYLDTEYLSAIDIDHGYDKSSRQYILLKISSKGGGEKNLRTGLLKYWNSYTGYGIENYYNDLKDGEFIYWDNEGSLKRVDIYEEGKLISSQESLKEQELIEYAIENYFPEGFLNPQPTEDIDIVVRPGDQGAGIKILQEKLIEMGYYINDDNSPESDEDFDENMKESVMEFQGDFNFLNPDNQITVDGVLSYKMRNIMKEAIQMHIGYGDEGEQVEKLRGDLVELGYDNIEDEQGIFGPDTYNAVVQFQKDYYGRVYTSVVNYNTFAAVGKAKLMLLEVGDKGDKVARIQQKLNDLGFDIGAAGVDGIFGADTRTAVKSFQADNKLTQSGKVNFRTKVLLEKYRLGLDYSFDRPTIDQLNSFKDNGISFICRYHCPAGSSDKILTKKEAKKISSLGIDVVTVYQYGSSKPEHFTYDNGYKDCQEAIKRAVAVEQPYDSTIYFAVDWNMSHRLGDVSNYFNGVTEAMKEYYGQNNDRWNIGVYGNYNVIDHIHNGDWDIEYLWQTLSWSSGRIYPGYNIYQYELDIDVRGVNVDRNRAAGDVGGFRV